LGQFSKDYRFFDSKNCHYALKNMGLGSGIRKKPIPDPVVKKAPDPGSSSQKGIGSRIRIKKVGEFLSFGFLPFLYHKASMNRQLWG
jgi:hypothetical protein